MTEPEPDAAAAGVAPAERDAVAWLRRVPASAIAAAVVGALFVIGLIGWLAQGAGTSDPVVPTVPEGGPTTVLTADQERVDPETPSTDVVVEIPPTTLVAPATTIPG